jgi:hypothetical protein
LFQAFLPRKPQFSGVGKAWISGGQGGTRPNYVEIVAVRAAARA